MATRSPWWEGRGSMRLGRRELLRVGFVAATMGWVGEVDGQEPEVSAGSRVALMGDSQAFLLGQRDSLAGCAAAAGVPFTTVAVAGSSVIQWAEHLGKEWGLIERARPEVLLVSLGSNDACMGTRIVRNEPPFLARFMRKVRRFNPKRIVWIGPPRIGEPTVGRSKLPQAVAGLEAFAAMVRPVATYLDSRGVSIPMWDDQLHPSIPGRKIWAQWIWDQLTRTKTP